MEAARNLDSVTTEVWSYRDALRTTMRDALAQHDKVILFGQGVDDYKGTFGSTLGLAEEFGADRVFDTPLAEEGMTGIGVGAALNGLYPIQTHIRVDFALLAMNQIVNLAAKYRYMFGGRFEVPMLIRMVIGRSWGQGAQHSQSLQSLFAHIPGLLVLMPATADSILQTYPWIIANYPGPVISLEHRLLYDVQFRVESPAGGSIPAPPATRKVRAGNAATVVATSILVLEALRAADYLQKAADIDVEVIDLVNVSQPDVDLIVESVARTGRLLVADTSWRAYGVCAEIARFICERCPGALKAPMATLGMAPAPCPTAKSLEDLFYPNLRDMTDTLARLVMGRGNHGVELPENTSMADVYKKFKGPF